METADIDDTTDEATGGVDFLAEDEGNLIDEDITQDTTASAGDDTQADGSPRGEAKAEGFLDADDVEKRETDAVEKEPCIVLTHKPLAEHDDPKEAEEGGEQEDRVFEPEWGLADEQVTNRTASTSSGCADDESTEKVELLGSREAGTGDGTGQRASQLKNDEGPGDAEHIAQVLKEMLNEFHRI